VIVIKSKVVKYMIHDSLKWMQDLADEAWNKACRAIALGTFFTLVFIVHDKGKKLGLIPYGNDTFATPEKEQAFFGALWKLARKEEIDGVMLMTKASPVQQKKNDPFLPPPESSSRKEMLLVTLSDGYGVTYGRAGMITHDRMIGDFVEEIGTEAPFNWARPSIRPWKEPKLLH
jgi:hypothetical protein